jgi:hypothetical protein
MAQTFSRNANVLFNVVIVGVALSAAGAIALLMGLERSRYATDVGIAKVQPIQFSHEHHVSNLGIHCAYCHSNVEVSAHAGIPPTHTCMTCHSQIYVNTQMLAPVRESYKTGQSIQWNRVYDLPEFVYFNHSIHINKGIGCSSCHGRVDEMNLVYKVGSLQMQWCLDCHKNPQRHVRPRELVFQMDYEPPSNQEELGKKLMAEYKVQRLLDCYTCHR